MSNYSQILSLMWKWCCLLLLCAAQVAIADMQGLSDTALSQATGQDGIAMQIDFHLNTGNDGNPLSTLGGCGGSSAQASPCTLSIQGYRPNNPNLWLVFKDVYGYLSIPNLMIDEQNNPNGATAYANLSRLNGVSPQGLPTMELHFHPAGVTAGDCTATATSCDINLFLNIGRMATEFGATGYLNDNNGSFMGLKISDLSGPTAPARMNFDGQVRIYGF